ncbi:DUF2807 domain-containing protein [Muribaculum sp.]|uniref:GIN domain-containing protein n=1 Tax=Muribaculum sp. TaxID=1918611 RepID=UPI0023D75389|nr:DUF2807 domain-containing protein [Muribaculum sp.]MDE5704742.1 DUF2807 domain-containing protein [Muribaculum sp.]
MRKFLLACMATAIAASSLIAAEPIDNSVRKYEIAVNDFTALKVVEGVTVEYRASADSAGFARFTTTPEMASLLMFSNNKQTLEIQLSTDGVNHIGLPLVTVYSRFLTKVENSGDSLVRVATIEPTPSFRARLIGNGQISIRNIDTNYLDASLETGNGVMAISGSAAKAKYSLIGTGSIQAEEVTAVDVKCSMLGTGYIQCAPTAELTVSGASSGKVYYKGTPKIKNRSIGVKVLAIEENQVD